VKKRIEAEKQNKQKIKAVRETRKTKGEESKKEKAWMRIYWSDDECSDVEKSDEEDNSNDVDIDNIKLLPTTPKAKCKKVKRKKPQNKSRSVAKFYNAWNARVQKTMDRAHRHPVPLTSRSNLPRKPIWMQQPGLTFLFVHNELAYRPFADV
jgi:hypothetical protein